MTVTVSYQRAFVPLVLQPGLLVSYQRAFVPLIDLTYNPGLVTSSRRRRVMVGSF